MEIINLTILTSDVDYSLALGEGLSTLKNSFIIKVCKSGKELAKEQNFDLLLIDMDTKIIEEKFSHDKRVIKLVDSRQEAVKDVESMNFTLYKYGGISVLSADILLYYSRLTGKRNFSWSDSGSRVVIFCSGKGGAGKTTVAFAAAQAFRRYYSKSVLYVSLEEIESTTTYIKGRREGFGICEYLYYLFKKEKEALNGEAFMIHDKYGVSAFMPDKGGNRLRELDSEKLAIFFKEISGMGTYDYILVDMGECFSEDVKWMFNICHKAVAVLSPEGMNNEKEERFVKYLKFIMGEAQPVIVYNKILPEEKPEDEGDAVFVDFDSESIDVSGEIVEISIDQDFGSGIKELVMRII